MANAVYLSIDITDKSGPNSNRYATFLKEIKAGDNYFAFYSSTKPPEKYQPIFNQMISTFKYRQTDITLVSKMPLPSGIESAQIQSPEKIDDLFFVTFLKSNLNLPVDSVVRRSGVLWTSSTSSAWKIFFEIKDNSENKNNPYDFWKEGNDYYVLLVDANGAGSGEGGAKLVKINYANKTWKLTNCFYYVPEKFSFYLKALPKGISLSQAISRYQDPQVPLHMEEDTDCSLFDLIFP